MLKFITSDASTLTQKRKMSPRACEQCRRKKKRCDHADSLRNSTSLNAAIQQTSVAPHLPRTSPMQSSPDEAFTRTGDEDRHDAHCPVDGQGPAYPGTYHSPGTNIATRDPVVMTPRSVHDRHGEDTGGVDDDSETLDARFIGDLNPEGMFLAATSPNTTTTSGADQPDSIGVWLADKLSKRDHHRSRPVPDSSESNPFYTFSPLLQKVVFPILVEECFSTLPPPSDLDFLSAVYFEKHHPIFPVVDEEAFRSMEPQDPADILLKQGICLVSSMNPTSKRHLRLLNTLSTLSPREFGRKISSAMRVSIDTGIVTQNIVLIQAFALLSFFIEGPNGGDISSQLCGRAVHCLHSAGLHHLESARQSQSSQYAETLTCCIWALDRLNAAFHGRPILMHERDIGRDLESCFRRQTPCFHLFLSVIMLLDRVIGLYRPRVDKSIGWKGEFPLFEELLVNSDEAPIPTALLATIEVLYHAVAVLSCRPGSLQESEKSPTSYNRQNLSATQINLIVDHEPGEQLSWFPFVPYAVSLALSVAYREMRYHRLPMYRARARSRLVNNCKILKELGEYFWSASMMAEMGELTLREIDKVVSKVANSRQEKGDPGPRLPSEPSQPSLIATGNEPVLDTIDVYDNLNNTSGANHTAGHVNADQEYHFDPAFPLEMPDFDVFAMFDPSVDLDGIDACLAGNFDMSFPNTFQ